MVSILVAYTNKNRIIGSEGKIPWNLPSERNRFKEITNNKYIIMGRKSFEEIGHALPYCTIIIVSKTLTTAPNNCLLYSSLEDAIAFTKDKGEVLIAGGGEIYKQSLPFTSTIYATEIEAEYEGDVYFPKLEGLWDKKIEETKIENNIKYSYVTYTRHMVDQL